MKVDIYKWLAFFDVSLHKGAEFEKVFGGLYDNLYIDNDEYTNHYYLRTGFNSHRYAITKDFSFVRPKRANPLSIYAFVRVRAEGDVEIGYYPNRYGAKKYLLYEEIEAINKWQLQIIEKMYQHKLIDIEGE